MLLCKKLACTNRRGCKIGNVANLLGSVTGLLWVAFAAAALIILRQVIVSGRGPLSKLGFGPSGVTLEFAEAKLDQAVAKVGSSSGAVGGVAKRTVIDRMQRNVEVLRGAGVLWVDDHPENNMPLIELLQEFGVSVDTSRSNEEALRLLRTSRYNTVISDVARDNEGTSSRLKGVELADQVFSGWGLKIIFFVGRFNLATLPNVTDQEKLNLFIKMQRNSFAIANRPDELLHYVMDVLERSA